MAETSNITGVLPTTGIPEVDRVLRILEQRIQPKQHRRVTKIPDVKTLQQGERVTYVDSAGDRFTIERDGDSLYQETTAKTKL